MPKFLLDAICHHVVIGLVPVMEDALVMHIASIAILAACILTSIPEQVQTPKGDSTEEHPYVQVCLLVLWFQNQVQFRMETGHCRCSVMSASSPWGRHWPKCCHLSLLNLLNLHRRKGAVIVQHGGVTSMWPSTAGAHAHHCRWVARCYWCSATSVLEALQYPHSWIWNHPQSWSLGCFPKGMPNSPWVHSCWTPGSQSSINSLPTTVCFDLELTLTLRTWLQNVGPASIFSPRKPMNQLHQPLIMSLVNCVLGYVFSQWTWLFASYQLPQQNATCALSPSWDSPMLPR